MRNVKVNISIMTDMSDVDDRPIKILKVFLKTAKLAINEETI